MKKILETERLLLREFNTADTAFIIELVNSAGWLRYIGDRNIHTDAAAAQYLLHGPIKSYQDYGYGLWCITLKSTGEAIGMCGIIKRDYLASPDIGYAILQKYEHNGYSFEAVKGVIQLAKEKLKLHYLLAITMAENTHSIHILQKAGFFSEGKLVNATVNAELELYKAKLQ